MQRARAGNVSERVAAYVAVVSGVGEFADADAIEDDPDYAREVRSTLPHLSLPLIYAPRESRLYSTLVDAPVQLRSGGGIAFERSVSEVLGDA